MHSDSFTHNRSGVIKGIIRSPLFKDILRTNLNEVDPHTGSSFVKTLMGEDPEVFFGLISSLPMFINVLIKASTEFAVQLKDKYPPEMLKAFLTSLYDDIDKDALRQCGKAWTELAASLWKASPELRQLCHRVPALNRAQDQGRGHQRPGEVHKCGNPKQSAGLQHIHCLGAQKH